MSWGYKIILAYVIFITGILSMVYVASKQTNEMQEDNYYAKELQYQTVINGKNNLNTLGQMVHITNAGSEILLKIPIETAANIQNGTVYFLRPSDQSKDLRFALSVDETGEQHIPMSKLVNGLYTVKISWESNNKVFFSEQNFNVQK